MAKHTQTIRRQFVGLIVFDHFAKLALNGLRTLRVMVIIIDIIFFKKHYKACFKVIGVPYCLQEYNLISVTIT